MYDCFQGWDGERILYIIPPLDVYKEGQVCILMY